MTDPHLALFEEQRQRLFGLAYRMLGSVADAQDLVQETYLRWQQAQGEDIRSPRAWQTTVLTRLCLNQLQSARVKREKYVGVWLPEPLVDDRARDPADATQLAEMLSLAFLVLLETLNPVERAVFILREGLGYEFADIADIVEKSEDNCRQILTRARQRIEERRPRFQASQADAEKLVAPFLVALRDGDYEAMLARMSANVVLIADGGDKPWVLLRPLEGAKAVASAMLAAARKLVATPSDFEAAFINGLPGLVRYHEGRAQAVLALGVADGRIASVFIVSNPDKLRHLHRPHPGDARGSIMLRVLAALAAVLLFGVLVHLLLVATHLATPAATTVNGMTPRRIWATGTIVLAVAGVVLALLARRRAARQPGARRGSVGAILAAVLGLAAAAGGGTNLAVANGGPGTGNGVVGAAMAVVLGLVALVLAGLGLARTHRGV